MQTLILLYVTYRTDWDKEVRVMWYDQVTSYFIKLWFGCIEIVLLPCNDLGEKGEKTFGYVGWQEGATSTKLNWKMCGRYMNHE